MLPARGADAKPDKKKSQAALQRGKKADEAGKRDEAIAAYTEAIQADASNVEAWRARGRDYQAAGDNQKAQADFDKAIETQPRGAENYLARAGYFRGNRTGGTRHPRLHPGDQSEAGAHGRV